MSDSVDENTVNLRSHAPISIHTDDTNAILVYGFTMSIVYLTVQSSVLGRHLRNYKSNIVLGFPINLGDDAAFCDTKSQLRDRISNRDQRNYK